MVVKFNLIQLTRAIMCGYQVVRYYNVFIQISVQRANAFRNGILDKSHCTHVYLNNNLDIVESLVDSVFTTVHFAVFEHAKYQS